MTFTEPEPVRPLPLAAILGAGASQPPVDPTYQRNLTTLRNKYAEMSPLISQLPDPVRNSIINYDSRRVAQGSAPLTRQQTALAIQSAMTNQQATPEPARGLSLNPLSILGNVGADLSTILHGIPQLPRAALHELQDIPNISTRISEATRQGMNPLSATLQAPGIRLIPGTYAASNLLRGGEGIRELATHPLFTALDVLPGASAAAGSTRIGRAMATSRAAEGLRPRPLSAVMGNRLSPAGDVTRTRLGQASDMFFRETQLGQSLEAFGGKTSRKVSRMAGTLDQRLKMLMMGYGNPTDTIETFGPRIAGIFKKYEDVYPSLKQSAVGPEHEQFRASLYRDMQRTPDKFDPGFINEMRDLQIDFARFNESQNLMGTFDGEWFPVQQFNQLHRAEQRVTQSEFMLGMRNEYVNPSGNLTPDAMTTMVDDVLAISRLPDRLNAARALEATMDAYGITTTAMKGERAALHRDIGSWSQWADETRTAITSTPELTPRRSMQDILQTLRTHNTDRQANLLEAAVKDGKRGDVTERLKNLYDRKPPTFPDELYPQFRDDVRSMSRRVDFDERVGKRFTPKRHTQRENAFTRMRDRTAPARYQALIEDATTNRIQAQSELALGRQLTPDEAGQFVANVEMDLWHRLPGLDPEEASAFATQVQREATETWRALRDEGFDPVFVHKVSPRRAQQALHGRIGPVPQEISQVKERAVNLTPGVQDLQVSLTHQASELLARRYSETYIEQVIDAVGKRDSELREQLADTAMARAEQESILTPRGHLEQIMSRQYEKFNPDSEGFSWGGARLDKYRPDKGGETYYIPKAVAQNLHRYAKRPSLFTSLTDPVTRAFRYNVIGLSTSVPVNNFISNSVAMMAEVGPRPLKFWNQAREWLLDPSKVPNDELRAMMLAEQPFMEHLGNERWLKSRTGQKFMASFNAGKAFQDSAIAEAAKSGKRGADMLVQKSLKLQRMGDNIYRAMVYMDQIERGALKGVAKETAEHTAMETVRRIFVDYASFTPVERSAMRTIIPFYSYMGHAARFIMRYPLDHPMRASIASSLAQAERERLGALPGSFMSMIPLTGVTDQGKQILLNLRPFDPFGDTADLTSVAGWVSAMNPMIQTTLRQIGVIRGEAEIYPTLRYDPETGRMRAVRPNLASDLFFATLPRAGLLASVLGANPDYNELRARDPDAANRNLIAQAGIPRAWREMNIPQEQFRAETARSTSARDALNQALRSGNWREALRYPSLRGYYDALKNLPPEVVASMTPESAEAIANQVNTLVNSGGGGNN